MTVVAPTDTERLADEADEPTTGPSRWQRILIVGAAALTLLLVGVIIGFLIKLPGQPAPPPQAGSVDVGFAQDMSVHHTQAVQMASWERDHTSDPALQLLATDIEDTQHGQVGRMQSWLDLWGAGALPTGKYMTWMTDATGHDHVEAGSGEPGVTTMPGMASSDDLRRLRTSTGPAGDVLWLQLMLRHHEGGASMLAYAADRAQLPQVRNLAAQMLSAQAAESDYLRQLLAQRGGTPLPL